MCRNRLKGLDRNGGPHVRIHRGGASAPNCTRVTPTSDTPFFFPAPLRGFSSGVVYRDMPGDRCCLHSARACLGAKAGNSSVVI